MKSIIAKEYLENWEKQNRLKNMKTAEEQAHDLLLNLWDKSNTHKMGCDIGLKNVQFVNLKCAIIEAIKNHTEQRMEDAYRQGFRDGQDNGILHPDDDSYDVVKMTSGLKTYKQANPLK